jgi:hypothetical protein
MKMSFSLNDCTYIARITGDRVLKGKEPLPWILFRIEAPAMVWDRYGRRTRVWVRDRVVIQGKENCKAFGPKLVKGKGIVVKGQRVPVYSVAADEPALRHAETAILSTLLQIEDAIKSPTELSDDENKGEEATA